MFFNIFKAISSRRKLSLFIFIQLVFAFISLNECSAIYKYYNENIKEIKEIIDIDNLNSLDKKLSSKRSNIDEIDFTDIEELYDFIINHKDIQRKGGYIYQNNTMGIDISFLSIDTFDIEEGRLFTEKDYSEKSKLPVIVGSNYKKQYSLEDNIVVEGKEYQIIGFLKEDSKFLQEGNIFTDKLTNLNDYIIMPIGFEDLNKFEKLVFMESFIFEKPPNFTVEDLGIDEKIEELSLNYRVRGFDEIMGLFYDSTKGPTKVRVINTILLLFITMSGLSSSVIVLLLKRKREFGILMAMGASKKDVIVQVVLENVLLITGAFIVGLIHFIFLGRYLYGGIIEVNVNISTIFISMVILFATVMSISLIILIKMFKYSSKELIGGI